jgi:phosphocarrier protein FPr
MLEIGPDHIRLGSAATDRDEALTLVARLMVESGFVEPAYLDAMRGREKLSSTFLGKGIAIPHGLPSARDQVRRTGIVVVQFPAGVPWGDGGGPVHLAVGIAAKSDEHVQVLANLTGVLGAPDLAAKLAVTQDREEIAAYLNGRKAVTAPSEKVALHGDTVTVVAPSPHGLHARPATVLAETAKRFKSEIALRTGDKTANARSLLSLLSLGATGGTELTVSAEGPDAKEALAAIAEAFAQRLGEDEVEAPPPEPVSAPRRPVTVYGGRVLAGVSASPGIATGPVWHFKRERLVVHERAADPEAQRVRLDKALATASAELSHLHEEFWKKAGAAKAAIFNAHRELLEDPELLGAAVRRIDEGKSAGWAWRETYEERAAVLGGLQDELLAARAGDLRDVGRRVLRLLADVIQGETTTPDHPVIILAEDLAPSDTARLNPRDVLGLCTAGGGATSHTAIIARSLDLPAVVAAGPAVLDLMDGQECIIDGDNGVMVAAPTLADRALATERQRESQLRREEERGSSYQPAITTDGVRVEVAANISAPEEALAAVEGGAEGVGLMRTEFLFLHRDAPPGEDEQVAVYETILRAMNGLPVILRTLDIGGDKEVPYLDMPAEENPFLGVRGLRLCLQRQDLFRTQLRAIFRASHAGRARLMFPMVTSPGELVQAKAITEEVRREVGAKPVEIGIMIEVPAAVVLADQFAREVDFFSIGTNDLTQYVLAMDRGHPVLAPQADGLHPAVLRMVRQTVEAAKDAGIWVGACGGIAGDPAGAMLLAGLGVFELSVGIPSIAAIKARLRGLSMKRLQELARRALDCRSAAEVRALVSGGG